jgi:hypothetical protein
MAKAILAETAVPGIETLQHRMGEGQAQPKAPGRSISKGRQGPGRQPEHQGEPLT